MAQSHHLVVLTPGNEPYHCPLNSESVTMGRGTDNSIQIQYHGISNSHCELKRTETGYVVSDRGSTNGTLVNGQSISSNTVKINDGDVLTLGESIHAYYTIAYDKAEIHPTVAPPGMPNVDDALEYCDQDEENFSFLTLSFVIPLKDEQGTLNVLYESIRAEATKVAMDWEIIFIDDGSSDGSWKLIQKLAAADPDHVVALRFRSNQGKAAGLAAGYAEANGDYVFTLDADLQDDPKEIPRFLQKMAAGYDIVTGWKKKRHDPWHKVLPSRIFNRMLSKVNGVKLHDHNCGFKCFRREVVKNLPMYGEMHRMIPSLASIHGYRTAEIPVRHHRRTYGKSKYGSKRFLRGFMDMWAVFFIKNYRQRPLHLMGGIAIPFLLTALTCLGIGFVYPVGLSLAVTLFTVMSSVGILLFVIGLHSSLVVHHYEQHHVSLPVSERIEKNPTTAGVVTPSTPPPSEPMIVSEPSPMPARAPEHSL